MPLNSFTSGYKESNESNTAGRAIKATTVRVGIRDRHDRSSLPRGKKTQSLIVFCLEIPWRKAAMRIAKTPLASRGLHWHLMDSAVVDPHDSRYRCPLRSLFVNLQLLRRERKERVNAKQGMNGLLYGVYLCRLALGDPQPCS
jgi:hypothetical protein